MPISDIEKEKLKARLGKACGHLKHVYQMVDDKKYCIDVLHQLTQRGLGGGFVLTNKPEKINILEVLDAVDPIQRIRTCPLGLKAHGTNLCALHKKLDDATAIIEKTFADTTIAEILARPTASIPLCEASPGGRTACARE